MAMAEAYDIFDRRAVRLHRDRAARQVAGSDDSEFLHREIADRLVERLGEVNRRFATVLDLGCRDGHLARALAKHPGVERVVQADFSPGFARLARSHNRFFPTVVADEEALPFAPASFDLVVANLSLHWTNDLPGALIQLGRCLKPDGLLLAALFGVGTLAELRQSLTAAELEEEGGASPRVSPFTDVRDAGGLLQRAGFVLPVVDRDGITVGYEHALALMADLRRMGEASALKERRKTFSRRATLRRTHEAYLKHHADLSGRLMASFEVIFLTAWTPGPDQPRALKPGAAAERLAKALGAREHEV
jgi:NADH dehydrogenase [ubiquinone] 1 alpha subcomplex assembly factor 5